MTLNASPSASRPGPGILSAVLLLGLTAAAGCPPPRVSLPELESLTDAQATSRIVNAAARRERMSGVVKAKLPGLQGVVMSATLDVAVEPAAKLSVAVRSFFEQPQQVLVTDGTVVTLYDSTSGEPVFMRGPVSARAVAKVLPVQLLPDEVVAVFLARPLGATPKGRLVGVDHEKATYTVWLESFGHAPVQITARVTDDAIVRWQHFTKDGRPVLDVTYADLRAVGDAVVPFGWTITLVDRTPQQALLFTAQDVTFNGPALPDEAFRLEPPPGVSVLPL
jgi:outer membrane lipoprotein-sorting protein